MRESTRRATGACSRSSAAPPRARAARPRADEPRRAPGAISASRSRAPARIIPPMGFLSARDEEAVVKEFSRIAGPVTLTVFASGLGPESNAQTVALIKEVAALDDRISGAVLNPLIEREEAATYGVEVTPAVVVEGARDYGIRF